MERTGSTLGIGERRWVNNMLGALAWFLGLLFFFPIIWVVLSSFKDELDAVGDPTVVFHASLDRYREVTSSTPGILSFGQAFANSASVVLVSTAIVLSLAIPAAYALAIRPVKKWRDVLLFFISTKFLPMVASILPIFILAKEFDLLACLMEHRGRVLSRVELKELVWDFSFDAQTKVVDLYVHYLRRKLGPAGDIIETVRGVGYVVGR